MRTAALSSPRKDADMTQDDAGSAPMLGSQPVAWAAIGRNGQPLWLSYSRQDAEGAVVGMAEVVPLYRQPQPALTDEEREAISVVADWADEHLGQDDPGVVALRALMARLT